MIPSVELVRLEENYNYGTFGVLKVNKEIFCVTLEPRDELNATGISSIPAQQYYCARGKTNLSSILRLGLNETFEVMHVPGRTYIKFHPGNSIKDTWGCILVAETFGKLHDARAVLNSGQTFLRFMSVMEAYDKFVLTITEHY